MRHYLLCLGFILFTFFFWRNEMHTADEHKVALFSGGCFWCMEKPFTELYGVTDVQVGYCGGDQKDAEYTAVASGQTNHLEAIRVRYNEALISYKSLLETFWKNIDPTDSGGQFADRGPHYSTAIFYSDEEQRLIAEKSKVMLENSKKFSTPVATVIRPAKDFYPAEAHHQSYYKKQPHHYYAYYEGSGRGQFIRATWQDAKAFVRPTDEEIKTKLTPLQYKVTQKDGTEPSFRNEYWDNKEPGIYVDIISGEPLFSSTDKFVSGTGWPSFTRPLQEDFITLHEDRSFFSVRTEVRSTLADSHLGHVFEDGPAPTGLRYCINSAALKFIPVADLQSEGYSSYLSLFNES